MPFSKQRMFKCFCIVLAGLVFSFSFASPTVAAKRYRLSAKAAIFSNSTKVKRYYGKNVHTRVLPASTVKVMTALIVLERLPLDQAVTISKRATLAQPSKIYARPGEKFRVRDLLYALLLKSANDAAVALAEAAAGSEQRFVQIMNARARKLGAKNTRFTNASGLPTKKRAQYTTAYDMYLIFRAVVKNSFFRTALRHRYKTITSLAGRKVQLKSHNKILFLKNWKNKVYGKTGWTRAAQSCFVGYIPRGKDICIIALFGATKRWDDMRYIISKYGGFSL